MRVAAAALARCGSDNAATAAVPEMRKWRRPASAGYASNGSIRTPAGEGMQPGGRMRALARHARHAYAAQGHCRQKTHRCMRQVERVGHEADCTCVRSARTGAECGRFERCAGRNGRNVYMRTALATGSSGSVMFRSSITSPSTCLVRCAHRWRHGSRHRAYMGGTCGVSCERRGHRHLGSVEFAAESVSSHHRRTRWVSSQASPTAMVRVEGKKARRRLPAVRAMRNN